MTKGPDAFRTISEAAEELGVPQHVLRFWETRFSFIRPMKRAGGRRFYRPQDLIVLRGVRRLLHEEGYTIKGVQKLHREHGAQRLVQAAEGAPITEVYDDVDVFDDAGPITDPARRHSLASALDELIAAKARLDDLLHRR